MRSSRFISAAVAAVVLLTPALFAAEDLSGKWSGTFIISVNGEQRDDVAYMVFKHTGTELTGTAGPNAAEQWPIVKGTVTVAKAEGKETTKASFDVQPEGGNGPSMHFDLELVDGHLKGKAKAEQNGMTMSVVLDLTRVK